MSLKENAAFNKRTMGLLERAGDLIEETKNIQDMDMSLIFQLVRQSKSWEEFQSKMRTYEENYLEFKREC